jgi:hypothetical protein
MSDFTRLDRKGTYTGVSLFHFAIASEMYSDVGHIIKYISPNLDFNC